MNDLAADFLPTATVSVLQLRARLLAAARRFFDQRSYFEVDTPLLSHDRVVDPHLEPFVVGGGGNLLYLQTSPEFAMKRLLAAGAKAIYQIGHVFRAGELGGHHNPEFTMIEWYRTDDTHVEQMQVTEELVRVLFDEAASHSELVGRQPCCQSPFLRTTYRAAFLQRTGCDVLTSDCAALMDLAKKKQIVIPESLGADDRDGWLNLLLAELVEPHLGQETPEFLIDYPASQAAIARIRPGKPPIAERFELYIRGIELCNGYHELTDPVELRRRMEVESARRAADGFAPLPVSNRLLAAMEAGLPPCAGVALGFDRLLMLATGASTLSEVLPFAFPNA